MANSRSKAGFSFFLSLHHQNIRLGNSSLLFNSVEKKNSF